MMIKKYTCKFIHSVLYYNQMLELAAVITTGGLLLFSTAFPIDINLFQHIVNMINDSKNKEALITFESFRVNYLYDTILGLVYIIAWRKEIELEYPDKLLKSMCMQWKTAYEKISWKDSIVLEAPDFKPYWDSAFDAWKDYIVMKEEEDKGKMATFDSKKGKQGKNNESSKINTDKPDKVDKTEPNKPESLSQSPPQSPRESKSDRSSEVDQEWQSLSPRQRFLRKQAEKKKPKQEKSPKKEEQDKKSQREWQGGKVTKKTYDSLDRSKKPSGDSSPRSPTASNIYMSEGDEKIAGFLDSDQDEDDEKANTFLNKWVGKFKNVVGDKKITKEDLGQVMVDFKQKLMQKNVAQEVAIKVTEAVGQTLLQTKTKSFTSVHKTVKAAMKEALRKILTPKRKIDLVVEVTKQREKLKPYVIVFVGVNGVGKSTNLAKVAYKLKNAKLSVMLAACDNFRAGAVEQIQTHGRNLDVPVFSRGYKEEPATIAYEAIKDATRKHVDAVLVDTAGRMQDNTPLMKELARLVKLNKPNLVVFIGQALVGNDAVDQITKFNKALVEEATETFKPEIDAILLSKFDTVDDKVGTALSLVYSTSKPILFVGVGQKYPNLKELNVSTVVHSLLA